MINDTQSSTESSENKRIPFGKRLKTTRESMGLERKEVAAQLHLNEKVILMMENDRYPTDLPVTFIRGYLRSYAKFLQIPEYETRQAVEPIKPKTPTLTPTNKSEPLTSDNYLIQFFTYLIGITVLGLVGVWWYTHYNPNLSFLNKSSFTLTNHQNTPETTADSAQETSSIETTTPDLASTPNADNKQLSNQESNNPTPNANLNNNQNKPDDHTVIESQTLPTNENVTSPNVNLTPTPTSENPSIVNPTTPPPSVLAPPTPSPNDNLQTNNLPNEKEDALKSTPAYTAKPNEDHVKHTKKPTASSAASSTPAYIRAEKNLEESENFEDDDEE